MWICQVAAYCQVTVDVITKVEHFGSSPAGESQELIKVSLQRHTNTHIKKKKSTMYFMKCIQEKFVWNFKVACHGTTPVCRSAPFPTGESCPTAKHLCLSLAWKVWEQIHKDKSYLLRILAAPKKTNKHLCTFLCTNSVQGLLVTAGSVAPSGIKEAKHGHSMSSGHKHTYFLLSLKKPGLSAWTITTSNRSLQSFPTM